MATKAYLMINIKKEFCQGGQIQKIIADQETMPEVRCIERIDGACDLLAEIETPIRVIFVANRVWAKEWVKDFRVLKVEPSKGDAYQKPAACHIIKTQSNCTQLLERTPASLAKEELERLHIHKEPLGSPTRYRSSLVEEAEKIIRRGC